MNWKLASAAAAFCLVVAAAVVVLAMAYSAADLGKYKPTLTRAAEESAAAALRGRVTSDGQPIADARVRIRGTALSVSSGGDGYFVLPPDSAPLAQTRYRVTAWKVGFLIGGVWGDQQPLEIRLKRQPIEDNRDYAWVDPTPGADGHSCGDCHPEIYNQWKSSGHATSISGRRLRNLFDGTDWLGNPNRGWNLLEEYPLGAAVCVACHGPSVEADEDAFLDLRRARGVDALGVHCDFCHKVRHVTTDHLGQTHGRFAMPLLRPSAGQLFFGPLDDVDRGEDVYSEVQRESRYCSACHEAVVFGVHVYSTYSEWLDSPARRAGRQCQDCHMRPTGAMTNIAPGNGGIERDPSTLASHSFMPGGRESMLKSCLQVSTAIEHQPPGEIRLRVELLAHDVGHRVPTGFIDRHLILAVEAFDGEARPLPARCGPQLPQPAGAALADKPGRLFAKLLTDKSGAAPQPFWREGLIVTDTRLVPGRPVVETFAFPAAARRVRVRLLYRRFWQAVRASKQWPDDTITVIDRQLDVPSPPAGVRSASAAVRPAARTTSVPACRMSPELFQQIAQ